MYSNSFKRVLVIVSVIVVLLFVNACEKKEDTDIIEGNIGDNDTSIIQDDIYDNEIKDEEFVIPKKPKEKEEEQKEPEIDDEQKDETIEIKPFGEFTDLNNTLRAWWFRRSENHQPASTDKEIENLIEKYGGMYINHNDSKNIYLTFDEGYEYGYTKDILDTLKNNNVKAAFFITSSYLKRNPELVERMVNEGHIVGNHSVTHPSLPKLPSLDKVKEEILGLERDFYKRFNKKMKYFRPPKGEYSERTLAITQSLGYKTVFWSFAYADWNTKNQKGADYAYERVMNELHNGEIMLLHAVSKDNTEALDDIIKNTRKLGYSFKTLDSINM